MPLTSASRFHRVVTATIASLALATAITSTTAAAASALPAHILGPAADSVPGIPVPDFAHAATADACLDLMEAHAQALQKVVKGDTLQMHMQQDARACGQRFAPATLDVQALRSAVVFYQYGGMDDELMAGLDTIIARAPEQAKAYTVSHYVDWLKKDPQIRTNPRRLAKLEQLTAMYVKLPDATPYTSANAELNLVALYPEGDARRQVHAERGITHAAAIPPAVQATDSGRSVICRAASLRAERAMDSWNAASAVSTLDACLALWGPVIAEQTATPDSVLIATRDYQKMFQRIELILTQRTRVRDALVGHTLPAPIAAAHWINAPAGTTQAKFSAPLTLLVFTAPECEDCARSDTMLRRLEKQYAPKGVRLQIVTFFDGKIPKVDSATVEQEQAYLQTYWRDSVKLSAPVAIVSYVPHDYTRLMPRPNLYMQYGAGGRVTYYLVDRRQVVRDVVEGYNATTAARLTQGIEHALH